MNGNYYQDQEIDCSCFDIHKKKILYIEYHSPTTPQKLAMKKPRNKLHSSFNLNNNIMNPIKTSLKKKISNTIMEQHHNINGKQNDAATQTILSHYKKQNLHINQINNKENRNNQLPQQTLTFLSSKHQSNNHQSQPKQKYSIQQSSKHQQIHRTSSPSTNIPKQLPIQQLAKSFKKKYLPSTSQENQQNTKIKIINSSDAQSQSKTIKKKPLLTQIKFRDHTPTLTSKFLQQKSQKQLQPQNNCKRIYTKAEAMPISSKKLRSIYPKQIQSFGQESISGFESEVLERERFTWAPDNGDKTRQKGQMTHTFHFRQTSSFSNVTDYQGSRISNQEIHPSQN